EVAADGVGGREGAEERAAAAEGARRIGVVEEPDRRRGAGVGVVRCRAHRGGELPLGRGRVVQPLEGDAVEDLRVGSAGGGAAPEERELLRRREAAEAAWLGK